MRCSWFIFASAAEQSKAEQQGEKSATNEFQECLNAKNASLMFGAKKNAELRLGSGARPLALSLRWCRRDECERHCVFVCATYKLRNIERRKNQKAKLGSDCSKQSWYSTDKPFTATQTRTRNTQAKPQKHKNNTFYIIIFTLSLSLRLLLSDRDALFTPLQFRLCTPFPKLIPAYTHVCNIFERIKTSGEKKPLTNEQTQRLVGKSCAKASNRRVFSLAFFSLSLVIMAVWCVLLLLCCFRSSFRSIFLDILPCVSMCVRDFYLAKI